MNIIPKFQQGGGFESLFTTYKPIQTESPRQTTSRRQQSKEDSEDSDKGKLTEKDLFTMLKDIDGLPNEIQALSNELMNTLRMTSIIGTDNLNSIATTYLKSLTKLKIAKFNKEAFDNALDRAVAKDNLNEIAITPDGKVLALNEDNEIVRFSTKDWAKAKTSRKYYPLTNSNLLWMRSHMPNYVYKNDMLQIVENGIGINEVHKMIKDRFQELGKTETSSTIFIPKEVAKGQKIIEQMISNGPDGYYKIKSDLSTVDQKAVEATFAYIYNTLPANAKTRLAIETPDGTQESVKSVIGSMILGTLDSKTDYSADYIGTKESTEGAKEGNLDKSNMPTSAQFLAGYGQKGKFVINPGTTSHFTVSTNSLPLTKANGDNFEAQITLKEASGGQYGPILDFNNVIMGGQLIDEMALDKVVIPNPRIHSIDFPCIKENGIIKPILSKEIVQAKQAADNDIMRQGIDLNNKEQRAKNYTLINQIYKSYKLPPKYNSEGEIISDSWARFGVMDGIASNLALQSERVDNPFLVEDEDPITIQNYLDITKTKEWDTKDNFLEKHWGNYYDGIYKGTIWIPLKVDYVSAYTGQNISVKQAENLETATQVLDNNKSYIAPPQI